MFCPKCGTFNKEENSWCIHCGNNLTGEKVVSEAEAPQENFNIPTKLPMPRATEQWLSKWNGPVRDEFWQNCTKNMSGDQKWLVYCLEWFLNLLDEGCFYEEV